MKIDQVNAKQLKGASLLRWGGLSASFDHNFDKDEMIWVFYRWINKTEKEFKDLLFYLGLFCSERILRWGIKRSIYDYHSSLSWRVFSSGEWLLVEVSKGWGKTRVLGLTSTDSLLLVVWHSMLECTQLSELAVEVLTKNKPFDSPWNLVQEACHVLLSCSPLLPHSWEEQIPRPQLICLHWRVFNGNPFCWTVTVLGSWELSPNHMMGLHPLRAVLRTEL